MRLLIALITVAIAALVVVPMAFSRTAPDINPGAAATAIGYADVSVEITFDLVGECFDNSSRVAGVQGCALSAFVGNGFVAEEHLTTPTGPATFLVFPEATIQTQCTGKVRMTVSGPGAAAQAETEVNFVVPARPAFHFGHLYFTAQGSHTVTLEIFVRGCYAYALAEDKLGTVARAINFDGEADT